MPSSNNKGNKSMHSASTDRHLRSDDLAWFAGLLGMRVFGFRRNKDCMLYKLVVQEGEGDG
jgi:hypothetical protein